MLDYGLFPIFFAQWLLNWEYKKVIQDENFERPLALEVSQRYWKGFVIRQSWP